MKDEFIDKINWNDEDFKKIKERDPEIFKIIYKTYKDIIYTYLLKKTKGNKIMSEDILSDTFKSAFLSAPKLKNINNILGWLIIIANRRFNDFLRKRYREKKYNKIIEEKEIIDKHKSPEEDELVLILNISLQNLKPEYRDILKMKFQDDMQIKEISEKLNKNIKAVESLIHRAKIALKKEIDDISK